MSVSRILLVLVLALSMFGAEPPSNQTNSAAKALPRSWVDDKTEVTCRPTYYRRDRDGVLVPVEEAKRAGDLMVSGVVLTVIEPNRFAGEVLSFHFDYGAEKWDHWYKPDSLYSGTIPTACIGRLLFLCDPGFTNRLSAAQPQNGTDPRPPIKSP